MIFLIGRPAYTVQGSNSKLLGTKLKAPIVTPSGILFEGIITELHPTPVYLPNITLPFISYGGTSLIVTLALTGLLINISRKENKNESNTSGRR